MDAAIMTGTSTSLIENSGSVLHVHLWNMDDFQF
jgi:hypothetical protein